MMRIKSLCSWLDLPCVRYQLRRLDAKCALPCSIFAARKKLPLTLLSKQLR